MAGKRTKVVKVGGRSDTALVVGAGMAGIRAALDLAEAGRQVILVEHQPNIGGVLMQLDRQFPTNDCGICKMLPTMTMMPDELSECCVRRNLSHPNIKILTNSTVTNVTGDVGNFTVKIDQEPHFVDPLKCISCAKCEEVCPVEVPNEFNDNLNLRKAIFTPYPLPNPNTYTLDIENCTKCGECIKVCPTDAIDLKAAKLELDVQVGAIILAPGLQVFDPTPYKAYSYGINPNILTSIDFERIYSGLGPYSGLRKLVRPSDRKVPKNLAFIQCVGSRNTQFGHEYCSSACCMYSLKEAMLAKESHPEMDVTIFYMDMRAFGKTYHEYYQKALDMGIDLVRCRVPEVQALEISGSDDLEVTIVKENGELERERFEMVVLAVGLEAPKGAIELADIFGISVDENNFCINNEFTPMTSSRPGIYVCGGFTGPKDIPEIVMEASAAAGLAERHLGKISETSEEKPFPDESGEPAVGIIICSCGDELKSNLDLAELERFAKSLAGVEFVECVDYLCLKAEEIKNKIGSSDTNISGLIIGACTPYQFELKFKGAAKASGLNPFNVELIDLRERAAWICPGKNNNGLTTKMAKAQLAIALEKLTNQDRMPAEIKTLPLNTRAVVIGGGMAGMAGAITLAENGVTVDLVEHSVALGGNLKDIFSTLAHEDTQQFLQNIIKKVEQEKNIHVHLNTTVQYISGYVGNFHAFLKDRTSDKEPKAVDYGAIILATGASEYKPNKNEYLYGTDRRVITQLDLERVLAGIALKDKDKNKAFKDKYISKIKSLAMIQCVGSRNAEHPYCSRVCCAKALKNALNLKEQDPLLNVYIIYQDIMTYGLQEKYYLEARAAGIEFLRYDSEAPPVLVNNKGSDKLEIKVKDILLDQELTLKPDVLVLSTGIVPNTEGLEVFDNLGVEHTHDNFLQEANIKFRPVDMVADGIFIAGLAHSPRQISESIVQAQAAAGRALTILNKPALPIRRDVSEVIARKCSGCEACISACPYHARILDPDEKIAVVLEPLCQACGTCAMVCPNGATLIRGNRRGQVFNMIDAAVFT